MKSFHKSKGRPAASTRGCGKRRGRGHIVRQRAEAGQARRNGLWPQSALKNVQAPHHQIRFWLVALAFLVLACNLSGWADGENKLKAAFLFNFAKLVTWPASDPSRLNEPLVICIWGDKDFFEETFKSIEGKAVEGRTVSVQYLPKEERPKGCGLLFVSSAANARWADFRQALENQSILTVGESPRFAESGGVINLYKEGNHMRFEINQAAAERAGLRINSRLLQLARLVGPKRI